MKIGMNYWVGKVGLDVDDIYTLKSDLKEIRGWGFKHLRVHNPTWNNDALIETDKLVCQYAKDQGFHVHCGITPWVTGKIGWENISQYREKGIAFAQWVASSGAVDVMSLFNEAALYLLPDFSFAQQRDQCVVHAVEVRAELLPKVKISTVLSQGEEDTWNGINIDSLAIDQLDLNLYGNNGEYSSFVSRGQNFYNAHGGHASITEFNLHYDWSKAPQDEQVQKQEMRKRVQALKGIGWGLVYPFTWKTYNDEFAFKKQNGEYRPYFYEIAPKNNASNVMNLNML